MMRSCLSGNSGPGQAGLKRLDPQRLDGLEVFGDGQKSHLPEPQISLRVFQYASGERLKIPWLKSRIL